MVGGNPEIFDKAEAVFAPMGRAVRVGPDGSGQLSKLANQTIVAVTIGVVAEAMLLAENSLFVSDIILSMSIQLEREVYEALYLKSG